jgi:hypothetical protein
MSLEGDKLLLTTDKIDKILAETKELFIPIAEEYKNADDKQKQKLKFKIFEFMESAIKNIEDAKDEEYWKKWNEEFLSSFAPRVPLEVELEKRFEKKYDWSKYDLG